MHRLRSISLTVAVFIALEFSGWAQGCAMCRSALESSPEGKVLAGSFAQGILLLLFLPYIIFAAISWAVYRAYRRKSKQRYQNPNPGEA
jgi:hypothetical protein